MTELLDDDPQRCPRCWAVEQRDVRGQVIDSRPSRGVIRRRRRCPQCGRRWSAYETLIDPRRLERARPRP